MCFNLLDSYLRKNIATVEWAQNDRLNHRGPFKFTFILIRCCRIHWNGHICRFVARPKSHHRDQRNIYVISHHERYQETGPWQKVQHQSSWYSICVFQQQQHSILFCRNLELADGVKHTEQISLSTFSTHCSFAVNSIHNRPRSIQMPGAFRLLDIVCHVFCSRLRSADAAPCTNSRSKLPVNKWKHFIDMCNVCVHR